MTAPMRICILTIFPEALNAFLSCSILGKASEKGLVAFELIDIRDFAGGRHHSTDDAPYGGGAGMVMLVEPLVRAVESVEVERRVLLTPQGKRLEQRDLVRLSSLSSMALICGRYEGFDERFRSFVDEEISIGDFVLTGGELPAMVVMDTLTRLIPGALGNEDSAEMDSFSQNRLDHAHFTRPPAYKGRQVPEVLLSGHHELIACWRRADALMRTIVRRPDLMDQAQLDEEDAALLRHWYEEIGRILGC